MNKDKEREELRLELERMRVQSRQRYLRDKFSAHMVLAVFGAGVVEIKTRRQPYNPHPYVALMKRYRSE